MIIELFGPPAAGKTTIARSLTWQLRKAGYVVEPVISSRPQEWDGAAGEPGVPMELPNLVRKLARPIARVGAVLRATTAQDQAFAKLIDLHPPVDLIWRMRLRRYLFQLSKSWVQASHSNHIVVFDQGYVQVACSLILLGRGGTNGGLVEQLASAIPKPDLLVGVNAPRATLEERLRSRFRSQGPLERYLEFDLSTNLASIDILARLEDVSRRGANPVISVSSADQSSAQAGLAVVERELRQRLDPFASLQTCKRDQAGSEAWPDASLSPRSPLR